MVLAPTILLKENCASGATMVLFIALDATAMLLLLPSDEVEYEVLNSDSNTVCNLRSAIVVQARIAVVCNSILIFLSKFFIMLLTSASLFSFCPCFSC